MRYSCVEYIVPFQRVSRFLQLELSPAKFFIPIVKRKYKKIIKLENYTTTLFTFCLSCTICSLNTWVWKRCVIKLRVMIAYIRTIMWGWYINTFLALTHLTLFSSCCSICCSSSIEHDPMPSPKSLLIKVRRNTYWIRLTSYYMIYTTVIKVHCSGSQTVWTLQVVQFSSSCLLLHVWNADGYITKSYCMSLFSIYGLRKMTLRY